MFTEYIDEVKESAFSGVALLGKRTFAIQLVIAIVFAIISTLLVMLLLGADFQQALLNMQNQRGSGDPTEVFKTFSNLGPAFLTIIPVTLLLGSLQYAISFRINDTYIKTEQPNIGESIKIAVQKDLIKFILYTLIVIGLFIAICLILGAVIAAAAMAQSVIIAGLLVFVLCIVLFILFIRTSAGYAFIVHGDQGPIEALKSSFRIVTTKRALILLVIGIGLGLGVLLAQWLIGMLINQITTNAIIANQIKNSVVSVLIYAFIIAGLSSFYFRYTESDDDSNEVEEHLIVE